MGNKFKCFRCVLFVGEKDVMLEDFSLDLYIYWHCRQRLGYKLLLQDVFSISGYGNGTKSGIRYLHCIWKFPSVEDKKKKIAGIGMSVIKNKKKNTEDMTKALKNTKVDNV